MKFSTLPPKQGLYDPWFEHDACGLGVVANIKGKKSNKILRQALTVLKNLDHRGGQGADNNSGDGAGVLLQIPHAFFFFSLVCIIHIGGQGMGAKSQPISPPFWHKAGLPPSKKYLLVRQPPFSNA